MDYKFIITKPIKFNWTAANPKKIIPPYTLTVLLSAEHKLSLRFPTYKDLAEFRDLFNKYYYATGPLPFFERKKTN